MKNAPVIGIIPALDGDGKISLQKTYSDSIFSSGGIPFIVPYTMNKEHLSAALDMCDGFLFTGGVDLHPCHYGEEVRAECGEIQPLRDESELLLFDSIIKTDKPIMGICRGCQLLNVALGGSLIQDIPSQVGTEIKHRQSAPFTLPAHTVSLCYGSQLRELFGKDTISVNSIHHQAIKELGAGLRTEAIAADGVIEAARSTDGRFISLIQWHPERTYECSEESKMIFKQFVDEARRFKK